MTRKRRFEEVEDDPDPAVLSRHNSYARQASSKSIQNEAQSVQVKSINHRAENVDQGHLETFDYRQKLSLEALPQSEVDLYLRNHAVVVADPIASGLRPITSFDYLPSAIATTFSSIIQNFDSPSAIQAIAWPYLLSGRDAVGIAETGSGKTLAFAIPLVAKLMVLKGTKKEGSASGNGKQINTRIQAVVITPTRELAIQVFEQIEKIVKSAAPSLKVACIYGGVDKDKQRRSLPANIVVATPGRLKDFMDEGSASMRKLKYLVLDEADRMLDKGFEDDIRQIIGQMPTSKKRQTTMFTATWPRNIRRLATIFMREPVKITIGVADSDNSAQPKANPKIKQRVEVIQPHDKEQRLFQLLNQLQRGEKSKDRVLVFCLYKKEAVRIERFVRSRGFKVAGIHGDMSQRDRLASLEAFKTGTVSLLVATDVAARGLDIPNVKAVINVTFPLTSEDYVHRIGRTGRAGSDGLSITLFTEHDKALSGSLINVLRAANQEVPQALLKFGTTVKKKQHEAYGAFFREDHDAKTATKIKFDD